MPSWKKVITSGSNASLAQISASVVPEATTQNLLAWDSSSGGFLQISQSDVGDNLGNHTATQNLNLANFDITSSKSIIGITGSFNQAVVTLKAGAQESPFLITIANSNGQNNKLEMTKDGILKFGALNTLPTAITGGLVYSASAFYMGL